MKKVLFLIAFLALGPSLAAFQHPDLLNALSGGLSGAFTAYENHPEVLFFNPSALFKCNRMLFSLNYNDHMNGTGAEQGLSAADGYYPVDIFSFSVNGAFPVPPLGGAGFYYHSFRFSGLARMDLFGLGFSFDLKKALPFFKKTGAGLVVKYISREYMENDYNRGFLIENNSSSSGFALDAGFLTGLSGELGLGIGIQNLLSTDLGLASEDFMAPVYRLGLRYDLPLRLWGGSGLQVLTDIVYSREDYNLCAGAELDLPGPGLKLRAGLNFHQASFGIGYAYHDTVGFDYAVNLAVSGFEGTAVDHRFGVSVKL